MDQASARSCDGRRTGARRAAGRRAGGRRAVGGSERAHDHATGGAQVAGVRQDDRRERLQVAGGSRAAGRWRVDRAARTVRATLGFYHGGVGAQAGLIRAGSGGPVSRQRAWKVSMQLITEEANHEGG